MKFILKMIGGKLGDPEAIEFLMCCSAIFTRYDGEYEDECIKIREVNRNDPSGRYHIRITLKAAYNKSSHCDNPVACVDGRGELFRWHAEFIHALGHVQELCKKINQDDQPYLTHIEVSTARKHNRKYDPGSSEDLLCKCGHTYYRHFDSYDYNAPVGCKYCQCDTFEKKEDGAKTDS